MSLLTRLRKRRDLLQSQEGFSKISQWGRERDQFNQFKLFCRISPKVLLRQQSLKRKRLTGRCTLVKKILIGPKVQKLVKLLFFISQCHRLEASESFPKTVFYFLPLSVTSQFVPKMLQEDSSLYFLYFCWSHFQNKKDPFAICSTEAQNFFKERRKRLKKYGPTANGIRTCDLRKLSKTLDHLSHHGSTF